MQQQLLQIPVLIVDDDKGMRLILEDAFSEQPFDILEADNGEAAVEMFKQSRPKIIFLDVHMPGLNGFQVTKKIRSLPGGELIPIVVMTGYNDLDAIHNAFECGATDFITKPVDTNLLTHRMNFMLRAYKNNQDLIEHQIQMLNTKRVAKISDWKWDPVSKLILWSSELLQLLKINKPPIEQRQITDYVVPEDKQRVLLAISKLFNDHQEYELEYKLNVNNKIIDIYECTKVIYDKNGYVLSIIGTIQDISQLKQVERQVKKLSYIDNLTNLPNKTNIEEQLEYAIYQSEIHQQQFSLFYLDIDGLNKVNELHGKILGDSVIKIVAQRIEKCLDVDNILERDPVLQTETSSKPLARVAGDEFVIILYKISNIFDAKRLADRIIRVISKPIKIQNADVFINVTIGIAFFPNDSKDLSLISKAESAMLRAKSVGKHTGFEFFDQEKNQTALRELKIEQDLYFDINSQKNLYLLYQPKIDLITKKIIGVEALARWNHPEFGEISPSEFIAIAERSALIKTIGEKIIEIACVQQQDWNKIGYKIPIAINLSAKQFTDDKLTDFILYNLGKYNLEPRDIHLELTESILMDSSINVLEIIKKFREHNLNIDIDDFGTGYSSLQYLTMFPINALKIDRFFIGGLPSQKENLNIIRAIISLAHSLNFKVIAEGIETQDQLETLLELGCDQGQGFYFSRPVTPDKIIAYLTSDKS